MSRQTYEIHAATLDSVEAGHVWVQPELSFGQRPVCQIHNVQTGKKVYCEVLNIDDNYRRHRSNNISASQIPQEAPAIAMNQWYRAKLGISKTRALVTLEIFPANSWYGKLMTCWHHPQIVVRLATVLACLSLLLGVVGLVISIF